MRKYLFVLVIALLENVAYTLAKDVLVTWDAPSGVALNNDFTVKVRLPGKEWRVLSTYLIYFVNDFMKKNLFFRLLLPILWWL